MRKTGKVRKCDSCGKWTDTGHPLCKECYYEEEKVKTREKTKRVKTPASQSIQEIQEEVVQVVGNRDLRNAIEESIANAKESVCILSPYIEQFGYLFSDLETLIEQKGTVKVVFKEVGTLEKYAQAIENLVAMKAQVKREENLHAKLVIVDKKMAIISSANLLARSFLNNKELGVQTTNRDHVNDALSFFNQVYNRAQDIDST